MRFPCGIKLIHEQSASSGPFGKKETRMGEINADISAILCVFDKIFKKKQYLK